MHPMRMRRLPNGGQFSFIMERANLSLFLAASRSHHLSLLDTVNSITVPHVKPIELPALFLNCV